jgi:hypothetical protein
VGQTLHSILVEVLLCTVVAMGLAISCLPMGTCCRCCPMFVSTAAMVFPGVEAGAEPKGVVLDGECPITPLAILGAEVPPNRF